MLLLSSIFKTLGTPTTATWKDSERLASFSNVEFTMYDAKHWYSLLPIDDIHLFALVQRLVVYNTADRTRASLVRRRLSELTPEK